MSSVTKAALRAAADRQQLTESALLKRVVEMLLLSTAAGEHQVAPLPVQPSARPARLYVRLTGGDRQLLAERAATRCLPVATYASIPIRAQLRRLAPLPNAELREVRQARRELAAVGRNLNQIARASNTGHYGPGISRGELLDILKACEALHGHFRDYVSTNLQSWESGDAAT